MQRDILALQAQFDELRSEKERLKETQRKAREEIEKLEAANEQATALLRRNSADFGAQIDRLRIELSQIKGAIETLEHDLGQMKKAQLAASPAESAGPSAPPSPPPLPEGKADLYAYGYQKHAEKDFNEARRAFKQYVARFPKDRRADNALYFWGESFFLEGLYTEAVQVLQRILTDYSRGDKVDDSLFRIGEIFQKLRKCSDAKTFYEELLDKFPKSPLAKKTRKKLKALRRCR